MVISEPPVLSFLITLALKKAQRKTFPLSACRHFVLPMPGNGGLKCPLFGDMTAPSCLGARHGLISNDKKSCLPRPLLLLAPPLLLLPPPLFTSRYSSIAHSTIRAKLAIPPDGSFYHSVPPPLTRNLRSLSAALARVSAAALLQTLNLFANSNSKGFPAIRFPLRSSGFCITGGGGEMSPSLPAISMIYT